MPSIAPLSLVVSAPGAAEPFVLLVDDHEPSLVKLQKLVEAAGYHCLATASSPEALVLCDSQRPSLVVTDLAMPGLDGQVLARWFKARYPAVPIVLVTGELLDDPTRADLQATFAAVFPKPLPVDSFLNRLGDLMPTSGPGPRP